MAGLGEAILNKGGCMTEKEKDYVTGKLGEAIKNLNEAKANIKSREHGKAGVLLDKAVSAINKVAEEVDLIRPSDRD